MDRLKYTKRVVMRNLIELFIDGVVSEEALNMVAADLGIDHDTLQRSIQIADQRGGE